MRVPAGLCRKCLCKTASARARLCKNCRPKPRAKAPQKDVPAGIAAQLVRNGLPEPRPEHRFHDTRKWRFDLAWPELMVAFEYEGGTWSRKSRHTSARGYRDDAVKYSTAAILKWCVVRATADMVESGLAVDLITEALVSRGASPTTPGVPRDRELPPLPARP